jgi:DNA-binding GntR family transcriptional regulator
MEFRVLGPLEASDGDRPLDLGGHKQRAVLARLLLDARDDAPGAVAADDEFHRLLVAGCDNEHLLAALRPIKRALLRYERVYMLDPARIERSAGQHDAIVSALESGDHAAAAQLVRQNLAHGLPDLAEALER